MSRIPDTLNLYKRLGLKNIGFIISKSQNRNIVVYELENNKDKPIHPYWLMFEKEIDNDIPKEELTFLEKTTAYGIRYNKIDKNSIHFHLVGYPKIPLTITHGFNNEKPYIQVELGDNKVKLLALHIHYNGLNLLQPVSGMDIIYQDSKGDIQQDYLEK